MNLNYYMLCLLTLGLHSTIMRTGEVVHGNKLPVRIASLTGQHQIIEIPTYRLPNIKEPCFKINEINDLIRENFFREDKNKIASFDLIIQGRKIDQLLTETFNGEHFLVGTPAVKETSYRSPWYIILKKQNEEVSTKTLESSTKNYPKKEGGVKQSYKFYYLGGILIFALGAFIWQYKKRSTK